jgi:hypothetical protein
MEYIYAIILLVLFGKVIHDWNKDLDSKVEEQNYNQYKSNRDNKKKL